MEATSRKLSIPRSGSGLLTLVGGKTVQSELGVTIAAWQSVEKGSPKRVVVRCDGQLKNQAATENSQGTLLQAGFPCGVLEIRYTIGGIVKIVKVDSLGQSALSLWCETVEVTPIWDQRRIDRLAALNTLPSIQQLLAATINSDIAAGDEGPADARWIDAIKVDATLSVDDVALEWSIHPIPDGARGVRFLDTIVNGHMTSVPALTTIIAWSANTFANYPTGIVQFNTNGATDTSILIAPPVARYLFLAFPEDTISTFDIPSWIEWIMAPATLPGY